MNRFPPHWRVLPFIEAVKDVTAGNPKLPKQDYLELGKYPVVDQGQSLFGGYTNDPGMLANVVMPAIVFGDHTRLFKFINEPFCLGADGAKILEPKADLDKKFLYHYLRSLRIESAGYSRHFKFLKENVVPVPPLPEQKRIATILDKAAAIRRKRQQAIQLADEFLRAVFLDMFGDPVTNPKGWQTSQLGDLVKVVSGATPSKSNDSFWDGDFPWVSPKDMKVWELNDSIDRVSESAFEQTNLKKLPERSVLIVVRGMILAHTVPVGINSVPVAINQDIKAFITNEKILPEFLVWFLRSQQENLLSKVSSSAHGTKRFELSDLLVLSVMVPDEKSQKRFLKIIRGFQSTCSAWEMSEEATFKFFQSLSKKAFSGTL